MSEAEALILDRSLRWAEHETALEEGWLLVELEQRFGYGLDELARRFDRSLSWVSRRLALVDQLPESVQRQVRSGAITAHVAMKFLVPVARAHLEDCQRMAEAFAAHRFTSREAGQLYAAWRNASPAIRRRILDQPQLFLKVQRQRDPGPPSTAIAELSRDLGMVVAIIHRSNRRLSGATVELDRDQCRQLRQQVDRALHELGHLAGKIPPEQEAPYVEPSPTERDSGTPCQGSEPARVARVLNISRLTIRKVLRSNSSQVPPLSRPEKAEPYRQQILELLNNCKGNLVRVQEELAAQGATLSYQALTAFCRRHGFGQPPTVAAGHYSFAPGEELQHDTSPHEVMLAGKRRKVQTASAVLCYSHMLFFQLYPTFQRFDCKVFLTEALRYFGGAPVQRIMIDNTHVVVLRGTGSQMVRWPSGRLAERFGFRFQAHERGDANRSGRVERPFHF